MNSKERKERPMFEGLFKYFPDALMEVSHHSYKANEKHNKGKRLHWDRSKSTDEKDALLRHMIDLVKGDYFDEDGLRTSTAIAWRALANLQKELEMDIVDI
jgi:hypothetical protein